MDSLTIVIYPQRSHLKYFFFFTEVVGFISSIPEFNIRVSLVPLASQQLCQKQTVRPVWSVTV